jgi:heme/copper-type cytochrome/quinol oxidase subunit 4
MLTTWINLDIVKEARSVSEPVKVFTVIVLLSLPTVMFGGYSLLRLNAARKLTDFQRTYFRAGHAHAGVLLVLALVALDVMGRTDLGTGAQWTLGAVLAVGILAQSGGMFVHMGVGRPGRWSWGNTLTTIGAVFLATGLIWLAVGVLTA